MRVTGHAKSLCYQSLKVQQHLYQSGDCAISSGVAAIVGAIP
ncbi:hypothetical protein ADINL_2198 [Nitrincola lacisaponensis]|uniref:Uncharacterized protein n=1 Tax=Nitrincola lacisaponensis TaxID=267850 RepID=A0A063Y044_9GAMM|nr:hypothetical protein ADINL_2198 [Nitrincola lacisaponensis]